MIDVTEKEILEYWDWHTKKYGGCFYLCTDAPGKPSFCNACRRDVKYALTQRKKRAEK